MLNVIVIWSILVSAVSADRGKWSILCNQGRDNFVPFPIDQTKFIICKSNGEYIIVNCAQGLIFSAQEGRCTSNGVIATPAPVRCPTPTWIDTNYPGLKLLPSFKDECQVDPSTTCDHWYRRFSANPGMFIDCTESGDHVLRKCRKGLLWDDKLKICDAKTEPVNCPVPSWVDPSEIGLPLDVPNRCPVGTRCKMYVTYPFHNNKFIECDTNGVGVLKSCPPNWHWSTSSKMCSNSMTPTSAPGDSKVQCGPNPCRPSRSGILTASEMYHNCAGSFKHFIMCDAWGKMYIKKCRHDLDWSEDKFACGPAHSIVGK